VGTYIATGETSTRDTLPELQTWVPNEILLSNSYGTNHKFMCTMGNFMGESHILSEKIHPSTLVPIFNL